MVLANVATLENYPELANHLVVSLVNIEEESTLKNGQPFVRNPATNGSETFSPPVFLNLYLLFSATVPEKATDDEYQRALHRIGSVIELFQSKKTFTLQNTPSFQKTAALSAVALTDLRLHPELYTLTFEQINHLWGSLGGKQSPFVMYKVRLVKIQSSATREGPTVETIMSDAREKNAALLQRT